MPVRDTDVCAILLRKGLNSDSGCYEWAPTGLKVFEVEHPTPGSDVAAIKGGNVSVTPLSAGFGPAPQ